MVETKRLQHYGGIIRKNVSIEVTGGLEIVGPPKRYMVSFSFIDPRLVEHVSCEREVPQQQYTGLHIGDRFEVAMYSQNGRDWYFSRDEASKLYR